MITFKILKNDLKRKKTATVVLFIFIFISSSLVSSGTNLITEIIITLDNFFQTASVPDFIQMHSGKLDKDQVKNFVSSENAVKKYQISEMISIEGEKILIQNQNKTLSDGIMDISFTIQNEDFDFLLDENNKIINPSKGEISIPVYYMDKYSINKGDKILINYPNFKKTFVVSGILRDAQMNPAIIHSKRFIINPIDYEAMSAHINEKEYIIEFQLFAGNDLDNFKRRWASSKITENGPAVDKNIFFIMNGLTEGLSAAGIIFISIIILIIALLCLRFILLASLNEDTTEIGAMKAIGIPSSKIRSFFMTKYLITASLSGINGSIFGIFISHVLNNNLTKYYGNYSNFRISVLIVVLSTIFIFIITLLTSAIVLRKFKKISPVVAFQSGVSGKIKNISNLFTISNFKNIPINLYLSISGIMHIKKQFIFIIVIFFFCTIVSLIPLHFVTTMTSPDFITYLGIGKSDIRIDLRQSENVNSQYHKLIKSLKNDPSVKTFSAHFTKQYFFFNEEGIKESIYIENGDFSIFPLQFIVGKAPVKFNEIALSALKAEDMNKTAGDKIVILINGASEIFHITGIYQDISNGGHTAKAIINDTDSNALWYTINISIKNKSFVKKYIKRYSSQLPNARVTDIDNYLYETLGNTITQIKKTALLSLFAGLITAICIAVLFLKMILAHDKKNTAIMKAIGFSNQDIKAQYIIQIAICLTIGIAAGTLFSNTIGQNIAGIIWSFMGAPKIEFKINYLLAYAVIPFLFFSSILIASIFSINLKKSSISEIIKE